MHSVAALRKAARPGTDAWCSCPHAALTQPFWPNLQSISRTCATQRQLAGILLRTLVLEGNKHVRYSGCHRQSWGFDDRRATPGGTPVRAVVRDRSKAGHFVAFGCEIAVADLRDTAALARAIGGASAVQVICPVAAQGDDAPAEMRRSIEAIGEAVDAALPPTVLAISDYGAELSAGTGVTMLFHALEERLRRTSSRLIFLRSAEHMQNWSRLIKVAAQTGALPSLHHSGDVNYSPRSQHSTSAPSQPIFCCLPSKAVLPLPSSTWRGRAAIRLLRSQAR